MVFACSSGPGIPASLTDVVREVVANENRQPRFVAEGREIVTVHSGRRQSPPKAREALSCLVDAVLATTYESLVDTDLLVIGDLVRAIRQAERNDPTPPANVAEAA